MRTISTREKALGAGPALRLSVGVDTGGTFTDVVFRLGEERGRLKVLSTPADPGIAVLSALTQLFGERRPDLLTYGTTVATNAMLERKGARTALVTTEGFEDVLAIGRQARPDLYALEPQTVEPLIPDSLRMGVAERVTYDAEVLRRPSKNELARLRNKLKEARVESVAVCLLHAGAFAEHEQLVASELAPLGIPVTLSSALSPESGEFERSSTTAANAYVRPKVERHIADLAANSGAKQFRVMQSNGGAIGAALAAREPIRTMLSGPAGGVTAAAALGRELKIDTLVTVDMGGTSTDVALVAEEAPLRPLTLIGGIPVRTPTIDIHTVGAGGGSIAWIDAGGSLKVGPESAGADPGPACYGHGNLPTVTDANLVLGRLRPDRFLGGTMMLDRARAEKALTKLAKAMNARSVAEAAEGVVRVVEGSMERAIRVITVERGEDPRSSALVSFGGAASLHACGLADSLGITKVVIPREAGLFSALGVLDGSVQRDLSTALRIEAPANAALARAAAPLIKQVRAAVIAEGVPSRAVQVKTFARLRYLGQSFELEVELGAKLRQRFEDAHQKRFHHHDPSRPLEAVGLRATAGGTTDSKTPEAARAKKFPPGRSGAAKPIETASVFTEGRTRPTPVFERADLESCRTAQTLLVGPAVVVEYSSTLWVAPGWSLATSENRHLILSKEVQGNTCTKKSPKR